MRVVAMVEFGSAKDKVMTCAERRPLVMSEAEKRIAAKSVAPWSMAQGAGIGWVILKQIYSTAKSRDFKVSGLFHIS